MIPQLKFHLPQLVPRKFKAFPKDNVHHRHKSKLDPEAQAIMEKWAWADMELYKQAKIIYEEKKALAQKCLEEFGEA